MLLSRHDVVLGNASRVRDYEPEKCRPTRRNPDDAIVLGVRVTVNEVPVIVVQTAIEITVPIADRVDHRRFIAPQGNGEGLRLTRPQKTASNLLAANRIRKSCA